MKRPVNLAAALLLSLTLGLHWAALQSVAWATMLIKRTQEASLSLPFQTTFDGRHPCKLCQVVEAGKSAEKVPTTLLKLPRLEVSSLVTVTVEIRPQLVEPFVDRITLPLASRSDRPPLPPPRHV